MKALLLFAGIVQGIYCLLLFLTALFLILLILIQRGRGGGLSGAFGGGFGGQSAFGAKAGDTFTKVTIVAATFWIILCLVGVKILGQGDSVLGSASANPTNPTNTTTLNPDIDLDAAETGDGGAATATPNDAGDATGPPLDAATGAAGESAAAPDDAAPDADDGG